MRRCIVLIVADILDISCRLRKGSTLRIMVLYRSSGGKLEVRTSYGGTFRKVALLNPLTERHNDLSKRREVITSDAALTPNLEHCFVTCRSKNRL